MNTQSVETAGGNVDEEISLLEVAITIAKHKKLILLVVSAGAFVAFAIAILAPNAYVGTARLLPPQQNQSSAAMLLGQLGGLASAAGNSLGVKSPADLYVGMLKSR